MKIIAFILLIFSFDKMSAQEIIRSDTNKKEIDCGPGPNKFSDKLNGPHKTYNRNRQISKDGIFKDNMLWTGKSYWYDSAGEVSQITYFKDGKVAKIEYWKNGHAYKDSLITK